MSDKKFLALLNQVNDAKEACRLIVKHEDFLGFDPYYKDIRAALIAMCERCGKQARKATTAAQES